MELTQENKKIARQIIEKGLRAEFIKGLNSFDNILQNWKNKSIDDHDAYHKLYKHVMNFDKHIAQRYDRMTGTNYLFIISSQLQEGFISENDLEEFSEDVNQSIKSFVNVN